MRATSLPLLLSLLTACAGTPGAPFDFLEEAGPAFVAADAVGEDDLLLDRLDVLLSNDADAAAVEAALDAVGGEVAASRPGFPWITVQIPRVADLAGAEAAAAALAEAPGVLLARPAWLARPAPPVDDSQRAAPPGVGGSTNGHLGDQRFYAAWNAEALATAQVEVWVADFFTSNTPPEQLSAMRFVGPAPEVDLSPDARGSIGGNHGWWVSSVIGADNDERAPVGTHADPGRTLDLVGLNLSNAGSALDLVLLLDRHLPTDRFFVLNTSFGFSEAVPPDARALAALAWREALLRRSVPFLHTTSAGNEGYLDPIDLRYNSFATAQSSVDDLGRLLTSEARPGFEAAMAESVARNGAAVQGIQGRTLIVGSSGYGGAESTFSNRGADVRMIGEAVTGACAAPDRSCVDGPFGRLMTSSGTSVAAPTAAGLAAWLRAIDPTLEAVDLVDLLLAHYDGAWVDALGATLALEARGVPVRRAWLDQDADGSFDEADVEAILAEIDAAAGPDRTWPRADLNGDGFASARTRAHVDLDGDGALTSFAVQVPGDEAAIFEDRLVDEAALSDLDVLCWAAYAGPFTGDEAARDEVLGARCRPSRSGVIEYSSVSTLRPECGVSGSTVESLTAEVRVNAAGQVLAVSGTYATDSSTLAGPCSTVESAEGTLVLHDVDPVSGQTRTATLTNPTGAGTLLLPLVVESTTTWSGASHCEDQQTETRRELFSLTYAREADGRLVFDRSESTTTLGCLDEVVEVTGVVIPE